MNNLQTLQEIKKAYNPKNAFGDKILISLLDSIIEPNEDGEFEMNAEKEKRIWIYWHCPDCGRDREEDFEDLDICDGDVIKRTCRCGKKHKITII